MSVQRMAGLRNALQPMHLQERGSNSPYFQGRETERSWLDLMRDVELDMDGLNVRDSKEMLIRDGYTIFDPERDEDEVRVSETIKDWLNYLLVFEVNRDEFVYYNAEDEREMPIPLQFREKLLKTITDGITDANKIVFTSDSMYEEIIDF